MLVKDNKYIPQEDKDFFILLRIGLWQKVEEPLSDSPDWPYIYRLSCEQTVQGIVSDGIAIYRSQYPQTQIPQDVNDQFLSATAQIVRQNYTLNQKQAELIKLFEYNEITNLVIKGHGLALNYPKPNLRCSGDIDFLLPKKDYIFAKDLLSNMASYISKEYTTHMHWAATIDGVEVELHGTALSFFLPKADNMLLQLQDQMFHNKDFTTKTILGTDTNFCTPSYLMDIHYTFFHILKHIVQGLGVRQICDLATMLLAYNGKYDAKLLQQHIQQMGLTKYWKIIASFCVDVLGAPAEAVVLYDSQYTRYNKIIWDIICRNGNFGHAFSDVLEQKNRWQTVVAKTKNFYEFAPISRRLAIRRIFGLYGDLIMTIPLRIKRTFKI